MKCLERNKTEFWYALYEGEQPVVDSQGRYTGETEIIYSSPIQGFANISAAKGEIQSRQFGENLEYDKVVVVDNGFEPIGEQSVLWVDKMPELTETGLLAVNDEGEAVVPHDYVVKRVARSLNSVTLAITKVNVR